MTKEEWEKLPAFNLGDVFSGATVVNEEGITGSISYFDGHPKPIVFRGVAHSMQEALRVLRMLRMLRMLNIKPTLTYETWWLTVEATNGRITNVVASTREDMRSKHATAIWPVTFKIVGDNILLMNYVSDSGLR